jgi:hypothetical protein
VSVKLWGSPLEVNQSVESGNNTDTVASISASTASILTGENKNHTNSFHDITINNFDSSLDSKSNLISPQKQIFEWSQCKVCNTTTPQMTPLSEGILSFLSHFFLLSLFLKKNTFDYLF